MCAKIHFLKDTLSTRRAGCEDSQECWICKDLEGDPFVLTAGNLSIFSWRKQELPSNWFIFQKIINPQLPKKLSFYET
jgi:hypothetical protein